MGINNTFKSIQPKFIKFVSEYMFYHLRNTLKLFVLIFRHPSITKSGK